MDFLATDAQRQFACVVLSAILILDVIWELGYKRHRRRK